MLLVRINQNNFEMLKITVEASLKCKITQSLDQLLKYFFQKYIFGAKSPNNFIQSLFDNVMTSK